MNRPRAEIVRRLVPLRHPLATARGTIAARPILVLVLRDDECVGLGEASPAEWVGDPPIDDVLEVLFEIASAARGGAIDQELRERFVADRAARSPASRWAAAALDAALLDRDARRAGTSVAAQFTAEPAEEIAVSALLGCRSDADFARDACGQAEAGASALKLKVGGGSFAADVQRVAAVRAGAGPALELRLDANRAWTLAEARAFLGAVAEHRPAFVEEPLRDPTLGALAELRRSTDVRIALDESLCDGPALERFAEAGALDVAVLKTGRVGGVTRAIELGRRARGHGLEVVVTDAIETSIGMSAALQVAAALSAKPAAVGLGGARWLAGDVVRPEQRLVPCARTKLPRPGLGMDLAEDARDH